MKKYIKSFDEEKLKEAVRIKDSYLKAEEQNNEKITELKPNTKVMKLFKQYPTLKDYMISKHEKFKMLKSPMFKAVGKVATVEMVSERTGFSFETLQNEFKKYLESINE